MEHRFDFLQIHDSQPLTDWERECIAQLKSIMAPVDSYTMMEMPRQETDTDTVNYSDILRMRWLAEHPDGVYIDTDCFPEYRVIPKSRGRILLPRNAHAGDMGSPDIFYIIVNGDTDWLKRNFTPEIRHKWITENVRKDLRRAFYGFPLQLTLNWQEFDFIPAEAYQHKYQTMRREYAKRRIVMENQAPKTLNEKDLASIFSQALAQQQPKVPQRHINDIVNEHLAEIDLALGRTKVFMVEVRDMINTQGNRILEMDKENQALRAKVAELEKQVKELTEAETVEEVTPAPAVEPSK